MANSPYVSFVVTTRNDDHGGGLLRRTQTFINALMGQLARYPLPTELLIVEWNPPADRPRLKDALQWPTERSGCEVRFIEVPREIHERYHHADAMPLYQMIGKNVGIRRAAGQFALATNIDLIFSDELMAFLAGKTLEQGHMYRIDRHDVMADVPVNGPVTEQLSYCQSHLLRIHTRQGTLPIDLGRAKIISAPPMDNSPHVMNDTAPAASDTLTPAPTPAAPKPPGFLRKVAGVAHRAANGGPAIPVWVPVPRPVRRVLRAMLNVQDNAPAEADPPIDPAESPLREKSRCLPAEIHTNACGDFTLMATQDWYALRAYPEWDMYSMHMDSVLCLAAYFGGIEQVVLPDPMRIYHMEHGSGWTPEAELQLFARLEAKGIGWLDFGDLVLMADQMKRLQSPMIFNKDDWGLRDCVLPESVLD